MTSEQMKKAAQAKNAEELMALAKEENMELTQAQAEQYFARLHPALGEVSDAELEDVSGGGCGSQQTTPYPVGTPVGIIDISSDIRGELMKCGTCRGNRFVVTQVCNYNYVVASCVKGCKTLCAGGNLYNILSLKRL